MTFTARPGIIVYSVVALMLVFFLGFLGTGSAFSGSSNIVDSSNSVRTLSSTTGSQFGYSVSISQSYVVVRSYDENVGVDSQAGRVYVYSQSSGSLLYTLISPNTQPGTVWVLSFGGL